MKKSVENVYEISYKFQPPYGYTSIDVAYVSGKSIENAMIRLKNFIDKMAYAEYQGREFLAVLDARPSEKVLKNAIIETGLNGRLN